MAGAFVYDESYVAGADLRTTGQYLFVEEDSNGKVTVCNDASDNPAGVLQNKPPSGGGATVRHLGITKVVSDGSGTAINIGDWLGTDGNGKAVKKATNKDIVLGQALDPSTANGTIIRMRMTGKFTLSV